MRKPVVGEDIELDDVLFGLSRHHRMRAAGIVADHPAERVVIVRGRVGPERQLMAFRFLAQPVEHDAGLDARCLGLRIEIDQFVQVFREIEHDRDIAALPGETCSAAARQQRRAEASALFDRARGHPRSSSERRRQSAPAGSWSRRSHRARGCRRRTEPRPRSAS